jgi:hypothetical protein
VIRANPFIVGHGTRRPSMLLLYATPAVHGLLSPYGLNLCLKVIKDLFDVF